MTERTEWNFRRRDDAICWVVNKILRLASKDYQKSLKGAIALGLATSRVMAQHDQDES